jgi:hypothetical protein
MKTIGTANFLNEMILALLERLRLAWWIEMTTANPSCIYYFGPFRTYEQAEAARFGYIEDLEQEGAQGISLAIKRGQPTDLTVENEWSKSSIWKSPLLRFKIS